MTTTQARNKACEGIFVEEVTEALEPSKSNDNMMSPMDLEMSSIPTGSWRDGLFDCVRSGFCTPLLWLTCCSTSMGLARVMTRLHLNACGREMNPNSRWSAKMVIAGVTAIVIIVDTFVLYASASVYFVVYSASAGMVVAWAVIVMLTLGCAVYITLLTSRTRNYTRTKYQIPAHDGDCEDCCVSFWCPCCTVLQVSRHADADDPYHKSCCSCC